MKIINTLLLAGWTVWIFITHADMKPSDNLLLWLLAAISSIVTIWDIVEIIHDAQSKPNQQ